MQKTYFLIYWIYYSFYFYDISGVGSGFGIGSGSGRFDRIQTIWLNPDTTKRFESGYKNFPLPRPPPPPTSPFPTPPPPSTIPITFPFPFPLPPPPPYSPGISKRKGKELRFHHPDWKDNRKIPSEFHFRPNQTICPLHLSNPTIILTLL